jgi:hypothetical protein
MNFSRSELRSRFHPAQHRFALVFFLFATAGENIYICASKYFFDD